MKNAKNIHMVNYLCYMELQNPKKIARPNATRTRSQGTNKEDRSLGIPSQNPRRFTYVAGRAILMFKWE